jgi:hypothetical protein
MVLTLRERRVFSLAPLSSALVWTALAVAGIWRSDMRTPYPVALIVLMTSMTYLLYLPSSYVLKRFYVSWRDQGANVRLWLFLSGLVFGAIWGALCSPIAPLYLWVGLATGATVGGTLALALKRQPGRTMV